jgi:hypothetical protein
MRLVCGRFLGQDMLALVLSIADNEPAQDSK